MNDKKTDNNSSSFSLSSYSHEVRNPLNGITGLIEILLKTKLDSNQLSLLKNIQNKNNQLQLTLNHMLEYSKLISGGIKKYPEQILIYPFLQKILEDLFLIYRKERVKLCYFIPPNLLGIAIIDPIIVKQLITEVGKFILLQDHQDKINLEIQILKSNLKLDFSFYGAKNNENKKKELKKLTHTKSTSYLLINGLLDLIDGKLSSNNDSSVSLELPINCVSFPKAHETKVGNSNLHGKKIVFYNYQADTCGSIIKQLMYWGMDIYNAGEEFTSDKWGNNDDKYQIIGIDLSDNNKHEFMVIDEIRKVSKLPIMFFKEAENSSQKLLTLQKDVVLLYKPLSSKNLAFVIETVLKSKVNDLREWLRNPDLAITSYKDSIKILIVDDEEINRKVMKEYLNQLNLKADIASNGEQAVAWYEQHKYDLIFMDIQMPKMNGVEATELIRSIDNQHEPYIIAITADALKGDSKTYKEAGMDDYLFKPIKADTIQEKITKFTQTIRH